MYKQPILNSLTFNKILYFITYYIGVHFILLSNDTVFPVFFSFFNQITNKNQMPIETEEQLHFIVHE